MNKITIHHNGKEYWYSELEFLRQKLYFSSSHREINELQSKIKALEFNTYLTELENDKT